jgi:hypothetical protein
LGVFVKKIKILGLLSEKTNIKEMAVVSSPSDKELIDIAIFVYGNEHRPRHAIIVRKDNHRKSLGRFEITDQPPKTLADVKELKEPIDSKYKKEIVDWAEKNSNISPMPITNWNMLKVTWNVLNPTLTQK